MHICFKHVIYFNRRMEILMQIKKKKTLFAYNDACEKKGKKCVIFKDYDAVSSVFKVIYKDRNDRLFPEILLQDTYCQLQSFIKRCKFVNFYTIFLKFMTYTIYSCL